jgi:hypothetical protein
MSKKPKGLPEFQSLLGKLAQVPKAQLDREIEKDARKKGIKPKRKRKK